MVKSKAYVGKAGAIEIAGHGASGAGLFGHDAQPSQSLPSGFSDRRAAIRAKLKNCPFVLGFAGVLAGFSGFSCLLEYVATRLLIH